jgi:Family of unknown function (DUF6049)
MAAWAAGIMAMPASASAAGPASPDAAGQRPWITITSMAPGFAGPTGKVTVSGIVTNPGGSPLRNASFQLFSTLAPLSSQQMASYLAAQQPTAQQFTTGAVQQIVNTLHNLPRPVPPHGIEPWSMTLTAHELSMTAFGVYPVTVQLNLTDPALGSTTPVDWASTFLPYWPGKQAARKKVSIAWVWPLIDVPQQTVCGSLASNKLAASVTGNGRLNALLTAGQTPTARQAQLTWAIDPALLSDLETMSRPYGVTSGCPGGALRQPSKAARTWLTGLHNVAAQQEFFTTPYADVDVAALALAHGGLYGELAAAFTDGRLAATRAKVPGSQEKVLGQAQKVAPKTVGPIAWPASGIASYDVLQALVTQNYIGTAILSGGLIHTPATVATITSSVGSPVNVLLANSTLTNILSTRRSDIPGLAPDGYTTPPSARADVRKAAAFAKEQWFRAETAAIAANAPAADRAVIVAPPRRWNPPPGMAGALLTDTVGSPWLQPTTLASLAGTHVQTALANSKLPSDKRVIRGALGAALLSHVRHLSQQVRLLDSILAKSGQGYLSTAVDTAESSAWRGGKAGQRYAERLVRRDLAFVSGRLHQIKIIASPVTLGGQNGLVPVSVSNGLSQPVTVKLVASAPPGDHVTVGKSTNVFTDVITVPGHEQKVIKIPVTAAQAGPTVLTLRLAGGGTWLPVPTASLTVVATHFGTLAIVIISIALVVFLVTATARAIRGRPQDDDSDAEAEELDPMPSPPDLASAGGETDSVVSRGADDRQPAKEADEHASTPGTADRS